MISVCSVAILFGCGRRLRYVISGKIRFLKKDRPGFIAETGSSWVFMSEEYHGAEVLEDTEVIEYFVPLRPEYIDNQLLGQYR